MAIIKCKMCGGDIEISADKTFGTCEYCGSTMTLPKVDDEQRAAAFNRGNHFRRSGEFDKALAVYERIVAEDDNDAEAHWCCALCRFGIEYVEDPATYEWLPTCHRASFDSFLEDVDYLAAVEHSDGITRRQYQKDAAKIAEVQRGILATSQNELPFDVFLCYKETGEDGQRTRDSLMAQEVYYELTEQGYRVFFARITLEDKAGTEYEPYIFAALNSAKVMIVIGTKPEHFNAVWVKNEWSRFLSMMKKDRSKLLLPCYRDMDPYDLPEALSVLQSYDMSKIGFMQDLIRGVKKVIDAGKPQETVTETVKETVVVHNEGGSNVQALLDRGQMALEDGEWTKADEFFEQVLNQDAKCGMAYLGKFLAEKHAKSVQNFIQGFVSTAEASAPTEKNKEACAEDTDFIDACVKKYTIADYYLTEKEIREDLNYDRSFCTERPAYFRDAAVRVKELLDKDKNFNRAEKYASGDAKKQCDALRSGLIDMLYTQEEKSAQEEKDEQKRVTTAYHTFLRDTETALSNKYKERLAKKQAEDAEKERQRLELEKNAKEEAEAAARQRKIIACFAGIAAVAVTIAFVVTQLIIPASRYSKAAKLYAAGEFDAAIAAYENLGDYKDSAELKTQAEMDKQEMINAQVYAEAETLLKNSDYLGAKEKFESLGNYKDAAERAKEARNQKYEILYAEAEQLLSANETVQAAMLFGQLEDFEDAQERSFSLWDNIVEHKTIAVGDPFSLGIRTDGSVAAIGGNNYGQCNVGNWTDVISISAGSTHSVGLKVDGSVVATGLNDNGQCDVNSWSSIVSIAAGGKHTVGLRADGTVLAVGNNENGQCNVQDWKDIIAVSAGYLFTAGLKSDGTVVAVGENSAGQCNTQDWTNIIAISAGNSYVVALKDDGTVLAAGSDYYGQCRVGNWSNIVGIVAGPYHVLGLKADGTLSAVGNNNCSQRNVALWENIVDCAAGNYHTIGLRSDGTVVTAGRSTSGQCNVSDWTDIKLPD